MTFSRKRTMSTSTDQNLEHFRQDLQDIKQSLRGVMETLQRLAVLEERFTMVTHSLTEIQKKNESQDERLRKLEAEHIYAKASAKTLALTAKIAWALGGGTVMAILSGVIRAFY